MIIQKHLRLCFITILLAPLYVHGYARNDASDETYLDREYRSEYTQNRSFVVQRADQCVQIEPARSVYAGGRLIAYSAKIRNTCSLTINVTFYYGSRRGAILVAPGAVEDAVCDRANMNECGNGAMKWEAAIAP
jgi:hypothetical protein